MTARATERSVSFEQTIPRRLVHRAAVSEVFITDVRVIGEGTIAVGAQWPRAHSFFGPIAGTWHDPMLLLESIRQAGLAIAHEVYGITQGDHFLWQGISFEIDRDELLLGERPADIVLTVDAHDVRHRGNTVAGMRMSFGCYRGDHRLGISGISWSILSPRAYARLRGQRYGRRPHQRELAPPVTPRLVGRESESDVVLGKRAGYDDWLLRVDTTHPVMFDHPVDHVPGMVAIEAARQAALLAIGRFDALPIRGTFSFSRYIEIDETCAVRAKSRPNDKDGTLNADVVLDQNDVTVVSATLGLHVFG
jgi:hypothetical protein